MKHVLILAVSFVVLLLFFAGCTIFGPEPTQVPTAAPTPYPTPITTQVPTADPTLTPVPGGDSYEPDDTYQQATIIYGGVYQDHTLHYTSDNDYLMFSAISGSEYSVETFSPVDNVDTVLYLYDTDGTTELAYNDDNYTKDDEDKQTINYKLDKDTRSLQSRIVWTCPVNGTYYLHIRGYNGDMGSYSVLLLDSSSPTPDPTPDQTPDPTPIPTPVPTPDPTPIPTATPTSVPTATPIPGSVPVNPAQGVSFDDTDLTLGELGGAITITRAINESDVTHYVLYWGSNSTTKLGSAISTLAKTGSDIIYNLSTNTAIPGSATHFLVFTQNGNGEMATGVSTLFTDIVGHNYSGPGDEVFHLTTPGVTSIDYQLNLGSYTKDVYFIFTNTSTSTSSYPTVNSMGSSYNIAGSTETKNVSLSTTGNAVLRGKPEIDAFNQDSFKDITHASIKSIPEPAAPEFDVVNDTNSFMYNSTSSLIPSVCRKVISDGTRTVNIWVANDCWTGAGVKANEITQAMVDAISTRFLQSGTNNDIYDWVTNIYGAEWGSHSYPTYLISANNEITILLYDIDNDNSTSGGVAGFFWAKDNFWATQYDYSNERIMFYVDAVMFATEDGASWEITDYWPSTLTGTLAHEFQHMINYYQKAILRAEGSGCATWLNEMCSEVTEDFVASKLGINGPRGIDYSNGTAGSAWIYYGRLPMYNYYNDISLTSWGATNTLASYSMAYSFGAYLARNYGGVGLFQDIVQSANLDSTAITSALSANGYSETYGTSMTKWAAANLLSDNTVAPVNYRYNIGGFFTSSTGGITYSLGSINLYNYYYTAQSQGGPYIYTSSPVGSMGSHLESSNLYYRVGSNVTGTVSRTVTYGSDCTLTIVVKDD